MKKEEEEEEVEEAAALALESVLACVCEASTTDRDRLEKRPSQTTNTHHNFRVGAVNYKPPKTRQSQRMNWASLDWIETRVMLEKCPPN